jgi:hypothetical protein
MGFFDFVVREGFCSMQLPLNDRLKFFSGRPLRTSTDGRNRHRSLDGELAAHAVLGFAF